MEVMILHLEDIEFDSGTFAKRFAVWGNIYVTIGDRCFPDNVWFDAASSMLEMWIPALTSFSRGHTSTCEVFFMDGPLIIRFTHQNDGQITAECIQDKISVVSETRIDFSAFLNSLFACAKMVGRTLYEQGSQHPFGREIAWFGRLGKKARLLAMEVKAL